MPELDKRAFAEAQPGDAAPAAASTMAWVEGPSTLSSAVSRDFGRCVGQVEGEGLVFGQAFRQFQRPGVTHILAASGSL